MNPRPPEPSGHRILVVDDNPLNLMLVKTLLASANFDVALAADARQALAAVARAPPQMVLLDLEMPGMDGFELTRQIKSDPATRGVRVVIMSAHPEGEIGDDVRAAGGDGFLAKPLDPFTFCDAVRGFLDPADAR